MMKQHRLSNTAASPAYKPTMYHVSCIIRRAITITISFVHVRPIAPFVRDLVKNTPLNPMLSSARTATATARSLGWLGRHRGNNLIRGSAPVYTPTPSVMTRFQKNSTNAAAESGNKQITKSTMDYGGGRETGGTKNQENVGSKAKGWFIPSSATFVALLGITGTLVYTSKKSTKQVTHLMKMYNTDKPADAKLKHMVEVFKEKIGGKFKERTGSILPDLEKDKREYLNETCIGMDMTIKELHAGRRVCTCIDGDDGVGKSTMLKRSLQGLNNVLYITMNHRKDSAESLMCTKLGAESGDSWPFDWRNILEVTGREVRDAGQPPIIVLVDDVDAAFKSNSKEMSRTLAFLMYCVDECFISLVILGNEPIEPFVNKAETSGRSRLKYVHVRPNPKLVDELDDRLYWGEKLGEPLCGAIKTLFGPYLLSLRAVSKLTATDDKEVKKDPTRQAQLQENVKLAVVGVLKGHLTTLVSAAKRLQDELALATDPAMDLRTLLMVGRGVRALFGVRKEARPEYALLIKMLASDDGVYIVDAYNDTFETTCKPFCSADLVRRELNGRDIIYRFTHVGAEVMARDWARRHEVVSAKSPVLTSERAKKQFDALKMIGFK